MSSPSFNDLLNELHVLVRENRDFLLKDFQTKFCCDGNPKHLVYKSPEAFRIGTILDQLEQKKNESGREEK